MADRASHDVNLKTTLQAVSNLDNQTPVNLWADPTSHGLILSASNITLGDVVITDGTNTANVTAGTGGNGLLTANTTLSVPFTTTTVQAVGTTDAANFSWVSVQVNTQGTSSNIGFQVSNDNINWSITTLYPTNNSGSALSSTTANANVIFFGPLNARYFRLNVTGISAGTTAGVIVFSTSPKMIMTQTNSSLQSGIWTVGSSSATGSAVPANAFYIGIKDGSGNLIGLANGSSQGDATTGNSQITNTQLLWNGSSYDRERSANAASNTTGTGLLGVGSLGYDGTNWQSIGAPLQTATTANTAQSMMLVGAGVNTLAFTTVSAQAVGVMDAGNYRWVSVQVNSQGTSSTVNFQGSNDNANWFSVVLTNSNGQVAELTSTTTTGIYNGPLQARYFRLNITGISAGTTAGTIVFSSASATSPVVNASSVQNGAWSVGSSSATGSAVPANAFYIGASGSSGNLTGLQTSNLSVDSSSLSTSISVGTYTYNGASWDRMRSAGALGDGASNTGLLAQAGYIYNGASYDRMRTAAAASNTTGTGLLGAGSLAVARVALPTAVTATNYTTLMADKFGRQVVTNNTVRDLVGSQTTTITASTTETTVVTAGASTFNDLLAMWFSNTSATATRVDIRDTTAGTIIYSMYIPAGDIRGFSLTTPYPQTTVNTNWTVTCGTSITDLRVTALFAKNQ